MQGTNVPVHRNGSNRTRGIERRIGMFFEIEFVEPVALPQPSFGLTSYRQMKKAKSAVVAQLVQIARKARLGYDDFLYISQQACKKLGLRRRAARDLAQTALL